MPLVEADRAAMADVLAAAPAIGTAPPVLPSVIVALNKADLPSCISEADVRAALSNVEIVRTSATTGAGLPALEEALATAVLAGRTRSQAVRTLTLRQQATLARARDHIHSARLGITTGLPVEFVAIDARAAFHCLGEITGETVTDTLLDEIFSRFCIGK